MHIALPDSLKAFIEQQVQSGRYASPSAYVETLIRADEKRQQDVGAALSVDVHFGARITQRPAARRDLIHHFVSLAEHAGLECVMHSGVLI